MLSLDEILRFVIMRRTGGLTFGLTVAKLTRIAARAGVEPRISKPVARYDSDGVEEILSACGLNAKAFEAPAFEVEG